MTVLSRCEANKKPNQLVRSIPQCSSEINAQVRPPSSDAARTPRLGSVRTFPSSGWGASGSLLLGDGGRRGGLGGLVAAGDEDRLRAEVHALDAPLIAELDRDDRALGLEQRAARVAALETVGEIAVPHAAGLGVDQALVLGDVVDERRVRGGAGRGAAAGQAGESEESEGGENDTGHGMLLGVLDVSQFCIYFILALENRLWAPTGTHKLVKAPHTEYQGGISGTANGRPLPICIM